MLNAKNIEKYFKNKQVVKGISLEIKEGEIVGLLGPNGAGKTTSFYMIAGFLKPNKGKIFFNNEDITHLDVAQRAQKGIIYLPQESSVFRKLTVKENFEIVIERLKNKTNGIYEKLEYYVELFELQDLLKQKAYTLSGGQKRKVEI
ncbi:MAG: ABC transporter ATP-binding protein, partial [Thermodesulfobacteriota bacterium]